VGIDEVGRGPWAGPIVAAAVALPESFALPGLGDSKNISAKRRMLLAREIKANAECVGIGWVSAEFIDQNGLTAATSLAMQTALDQIYCKFNEVIIDGNVKYLAGGLCRYEIKADGKYPAVSAASIIAKVARDQYMSAMSVIYPGYGFEANAGYGTKNHKDGLDQLGLCLLHRLSFKPVANYHVNAKGENS
jgi:ribonuclease HII